MIEIEVGPGDVAASRFAVAPLTEVHTALGVLARSLPPGPLRPWAARARPIFARLLDDPAVRALAHLGRNRGYIADFITPPPETPFPEFDQELERLVSTPHERVLGDMALCEERNGRIPPAATALLEDPDAGLALIVDQMRRYWDDALASHWPRIRSLLEGDVLHRARQLPK